MIPKQLEAGLFLIKKPNSKKNYMICNDEGIKYSKILRDYEGVNEYLNKGSNVALVLSSLPIVVVDTDNPKALAFANKKGLSSTLTEETRRGYHLYYRIPEHVTRYRQHTYKNGLELKCTSDKESTLNVTCCPSQIDGTAYKVINDTDIAYAPKWILDAIYMQESTYTYLDDYEDIPIHIVSDILDRIDDYDTYKTYLNVGMCLHNIFEGDEIGLDLWDEWACNSNRYQEWTNRSKYNGFNNDRYGKKQSLNALKKLI